MSNEASVTSQLAAEQPEATKSIPTPITSECHKEKELAMQPGDQQNRKKMKQVPADSAVADTAATAVASSAPSAPPDPFADTEIVFCLGNRADVRPHDVSQLMLWAIPSPVPMIESPKCFALKNKSRLTDMLVVYVKGWSFDMMTCSGVGLPRRRRIGEKRSRPKETEGEEQDPTQDAHPAAGSEEEQPKSSGVENGEEAGEEEEEEEEDLTWSKRVCFSLLEPVRRQQCWARAPGVQYAPLYIQNTRDAFEHDLWWRGSDPRLAGASRSSGRRARGEGSEGTPPAAQSRGKGGDLKWAVQRAKERQKKSANAEETESAAAAPATAEDASGASYQSPTAQYEPGSVVWADRAKLDSFALRLPADARTLRSLEYTCGPEDLPPDAPDAAEWRAIPPSAAKADTAASADEAPRVYALDCEMVVTSGRVSSLARATLVDVISGSVVLDQLVKPADEVIDYVTHFSGIDAALLDPVTATLADCQDKILSFVDADTYVVGHSLENDFKACKLFPTCKVLDTAWLFPHPCGLPRKNALRFLAMRYLKKKIQSGSHDSAEDAAVSAELVQLKLENGKHFGVQSSTSVLAVMTGVPPETVESVATAAEQNEEGQQKAVSQPPPPSPPPFPVHVQLFDEASVLSTIMPKKTSTNRIDPIPVRSDGDATRKVVSALQRRRQQLQQAAASSCSAQTESAPAPPPFSVVWVQLTETALDVTLPPRAETPQEVESHEEAQLAKSRKVNQRVLRIVEAAPDNTLVLVMCGDCRGEEGGNHFSKAHGACFGFVKDSNARGPPEQYLSETPATEDGATPSS